MVNTQDRAVPSKNPPFPSPPLPFHFHFPHSAVARAVSGWADNFFDPSLQQRFRTATASIACARPCLAKHGTTLLLIRTKKNREAFGVYNVSGARHHHSPSPSSIYYVAIRIST